MLRALADRLGIARSYVDTGGVTRFPSDRTRIDLLAAMGFRATTEKEAAVALRALEADERARLLAPTRVLREGDADAGAAEIATGRKPGEPVAWEAQLREESGRVVRWQGRGETGAGGCLRVPLPEPLSPGYHVLEIAAGCGREERTGRQTLITAPRACFTPQELLGSRRVFGLCANLYAVRSRRNWGAGDLTDLRALVRWAGERGAAFVGLNPLHALWNEGDDVSPYFPLSRLYRNALCLDLTAIPEFEAVRQAHPKLLSPAVLEKIEHLGEARYADYAAIKAIELPVLRQLYRAFAAQHQGRATLRGRDYERYKRSQGPSLLHFATFLALAEHSMSSPDWRLWPPAYRDPHSPQVRAFGQAQRNEVEFHCYLQFEIERQLAAAAAEARAAGLRIGLYHDLALGSAPGGADTWVFGDLFLHGITLGAPPDAYAPQGQNWGLPPVDPRRLAADGYRYWILLLRNAFAHGGALRLDHVMGLFRQYWIPAGRTAAEGAYVRFPAADLLGIRAVEARRAGALGVGEDLGTVPAGRSETLADWGILSSRVLYFEQDAAGFRAPEAYPRRALVTANTHDLPTLSAFRTGRDLELRRALGVLPSDSDLARAREERERELARLRARLAVEGLVRDPHQPLSDVEFRRAVYALLSRTPAALLGVSLEDLIGEVEPANVPGVGPDRYPSWRRKLAVPLELLPHDPGAREVLSALCERVSRADVTSSHA